MRSIGLHSIPKTSLKKNSAVLCPENNFGRDIEIECPICEFFEERRIAAWECKELFDETVPTNILNDALSMRDFHALEEVDQEFTCTYE